MTRGRNAAAWHDTGLVFTTRYGTPIEPRNFNRFWDRRCEAAGVRRITVRDARRTCASLLADLDVHPRVAMQILRHAQFAITMEIYTQVSSRQTREALKRLGRRWTDDAPVAVPSCCTDRIRPPGPLGYLR
jgi:integrase